MGNVICTRCLSNQATLSTLECEESKNQPTKKLDFYKNVDTQPPEMNIISTKVSTNRGEKVRAISTLPVSYYKDISDGDVNSDKEGKESHNINNDTTPAKSTITIKELKHGLQREENEPKGNNGVQNVQSLLARKSKSIDLKIGKKKKFINPNEDYSVKVTFEPSKMVKKTNPSDAKIVESHHAIRKFKDLENRFIDLEENIVYNRLSYKKTDVKYDNNKMFGKSSKTYVAAGKNRKKEDRSQKAASPSIEKDRVKISSILTGDGDTSKLKLSTLADDSKVDSYGKISTFSGRSAGAIGENFLIRVEDTKKTTNQKDWRDYDIDDERRNRRKMDRHTVFSMPRLGIGDPSATKISKIYRNDPFSCSECEDIYRMAILNNLPLKNYECLSCGNLINPSSLNFYINKYINSANRSKLMITREDDQVQEDFAKGKQINTESEEENKRGRNDKVNTKSLHLDFRKLVKRNERGSSDDYVEDKPKFAFPDRDEIKYIFSYLMNKKKDDQEEEDMEELDEKPNFPFNQNRNFRDLCPSTARASATTKVPRLKMNNMTKFKNLGDPSYQVPLSARDVSKISNIGSAFSLDQARHFYEFLKKDEIGVKFLINKDTKFLENQGLERSQILQFYANFDKERKILKNKELEKHNNLTERVRQSKMSTEYILPPNGNASTFFSFTNNRTTQMPRYTYKQAPKGKSYIFEVDEERSILSNRESKTEKVKIGTEPDFQYEFETIREKHRKGNVGDILLQNRPNVDRYYERFETSTLEELGFKPSEMNEIYNFIKNNGSNYINRVDRKELADLGFKKHQIDKLDHFIKQCKQKVTDKGIKQEKERSPKGEFYHFFKMEIESKEAKDRRYLRPVGLNKDSINQFWDQLKVDGKGNYELGNPQKKSLEYQGYTKDQINEFIKYLKHFNDYKKQIPPPSQAVFKRTLKDIDLRPLNQQGFNKGDLDKLNRIIKTVKNINELTPKKLEKEGFLPYQIEKFAKLVEEFERTPRDMPPYSDRVEKGDILEEVNPKKLRDLYKFINKNKLIGNNLLQDRGLKNDQIPEFIEALKKYFTSASKPEPKSKTQKHVQIKEGEVEDELLKEEEAPRVEKKFLRKILKTEPSQHTHADLHSPSSHYSDEELERLNQNNTLRLKKLKEFKDKRDKQNFLKSGTESEPYYDKDKNMHKAKQFNYETSSVDLLTDDELDKKLKNFAKNVGPINTDSEDELVDILLEHKLRDLKTWEDLNKKKLSPEKNGELFTNDEVKDLKEYDQLKRWLKNRKKQNPNYNYRTSSPESYSDYDYDEKQKEKEDEYLDKRNKLRTIINREKNKFDELTGFKKPQDKFTSSFIPDSFYSSSGPLSARNKKKKDGFLDFGKVYNPYNTNYDDLTANQRRCTNAYLDRKLKREMAEMKERQRRIDAENKAVERQMENQLKKDQQKLEYEKTKELERLRLEGMQKDKERRIELERQAREEAKEKEREREEMKKHENELRRVEWEREQDKLRKEQEEREDRKREEALNAELLRQKEKERKAEMERDRERQRELERQKRELERLEQEKQNELDKQKREEEKLRQERLREEEKERADYERKRRQKEREDELERQRHEDERKRKLEEDKKEQERLENERKRKNEQERLEEERKEQERLRDLTRDKNMREREELEKRRLEEEKRRKEELEKKLKQDELDRKNRKGLKEREEEERKRREAQRLLDEEQRKREAEEKEKERLRLLNEQDSLREKELAIQREKEEQERLQRLKEEEDAIRRKQEKEKLLEEARLEEERRRLEEDRLRLEELEREQRERDKIDKFKFEILNREANQDAMAEEEDLLIQKADLLEKIEFMITIKNLDKKHMGNDFKLEILYSNTENPRDFYTIGTSEKRRVKGTELNFPEIFDFNFLFERMQFIRIIFNCTNESASELTINLARVITGKLQPLISPLNLLHSDFQYFTGNRNDNKKQSIIINFKRATKNVALLLPNFQMDFKFPQAGRLANRLRYYFIIEYESGELRNVYHSNELMGKSNLSFCIQSFFGTKEFMNKDVRRYIIEFWEGSNDYLGKTVLEKKEMEQILENKSKKHPYDVSNEDSANLNFSPQKSLNKDKSRKELPTTASKKDLPSPSKQNKGQMDKKLSPNKKNPKEFIVGKINIHYEERRRKKFFDLICDGINIAFEIAVDYTSSNKDPKDPNSLHTIHLENNLYSRVITACGNVLREYDSDQLFPIWGFGGVPPGGSSVSHCFNLNGKREPSVQGIEGVIDTYVNTLKDVQLVGPTYFQHIFRAVLDLAKKDQSKKGPPTYHVFLILTDGKIDDMDVTKELSLECSKLPISIIIVGVGEGDFGKMDILDGNEIAVTNPITGETIYRDNIQFVSFRDLDNDGTKLCTKVLEPIPIQVEEFGRKKGI